VNFLPKDERFFDYFHQQSGVLCQAAHLLVGGLKEGFQSAAQAAKRIEALERSGDNITHQIFDRLRATFITPFDPEDIQSLATALDDVIDTIEDAAFRIVAYRIDPIPAAVIELAEMIANSCNAIDRALHALHDRESVMEPTIEVNRLEDEADAVERNMLIDLFSSGYDAVTIIKLKDLYEMLEQTTDRCEDVADVIQNIAVKNL
jgi:predicted phosphate transport protein (TIGR00153 family)